ncbi:MAG: cyclic pyranopterin monophosphate synthase MoaC [Acidimicrobiales bacterium]
MGTRSSEHALQAGVRTALTHIDAAGRARMVDVTQKPWTHRQATARCRVALGEGGGTAARPDAAQPQPAGDRSWSEMLEVARLAGIQAAKQTSRLIPLCHQLTSCTVQVALSVFGGVLEVESHAEVIGPTGVEMEALTACAMAGLTLLAALLPSHPEASIEALALWEKSGGRSGTWIRA